MQSVLSLLNSQVSGDMGQLPDQYHSDEIGDVRKLLKMTATSTLYNSTAHEKDLYCIPKSECGLIVSTVAIYSLCFSML